MEKYLKDNYLDDITELINDTNERSHVSLHVDLTKLQQHNFEWFSAILDDVQFELPKWNGALFAVQRTIATDNDGFLDPGYQIKINCHVRFVHLPAGDARYKIPFPNYDQVGQFREITGNVVRMTQMKLLELKREFVCTKCGEIIIVEADYGLMYRFEVPRQCETVGCKGAVHQKHKEPLPKYCVHYQEIKIQEVLSDKSIPPTLIITLDDDLVDSCQPGDCVTVCGTIERRFTSFQYEGRCSAIIAMRAVSLTREQNHLTVNTKHLSEQMLLMQFEWAENLEKFGELGLRDIILDSICPDVRGLYPIKLAIALAICSGNNEETDTKNNYGLHQRGQSHVLLIGDPGLAKSKLLLSAVSIAPRAVHTTGMGCSSAGLTAAAIKEGGEWQLEAGALVLADGGICCIDEFNLMRESDRASIHEAMEQQTISMAKAGIVCKLNTRCAIIAAANPKNLYSMSEPEGPSSINIGIASPLLSRFDLVFILRDERNPEWDAEIADHLLAQVCSGFQHIAIEKNENLWDVHRLQTHFAAICNVQPRMSDEAKEIISTYYRRCRADLERDHARTTVRLLDSLHRLAEAHARLVFRSEVTVVDAIIVIRLMESTFGFGKTVKPYDVIKDELPLGPDSDEINDILKVLGLEPKKSGGGDPPKTVPEDNLPQNKPNTQETTQMPPKIPSESVSQRISTLPSTQPLTQTSFRPSTQPRQISQSPIQTTSNNPPQPPPIYDPEELDRILSFEEPKSQSMPVAESTSCALDDTEDAILSQALDDIEQSTKSPPPKIRKVELNRSRRLHMALKKYQLPAKIDVSTNKKGNISTDTHEQPKENLASKTENLEVATHSLNKSIRNRLFCTPSDSESSQLTSQMDRPLVANHSTQIGEIVDLKSTPMEEDSAYDTMSFSSNTMPSAFMKEKPKTTPPLFPPSASGKTTVEQDLSFLDTLEF